MITLDELMTRDTPLPKLLAMMGLPRSGKSTFCRKYLRPFGYVTVCPDEFRLALHGQRFLKSAEPIVWAAVTIAVDALLRTGEIVVVDATNITAKARQPWIDRGAEFIHIDTNVHTCILRAGDNLELISVINRMNAEQFTDDRMLWNNTK